jgi:APA family basic amino acid/polyamine antiporter
MALAGRPPGNRLLIKKSIDQVQREASTGHLKRTLGPINLVLLGIGCIIGAGIYVITGTAAANFAGPAVMLSFIIAGMACAFAGLCYAELASTMPVAGSAYTYSYTTLGEIFAWTMGWLLVLEYGVAAATVAAGWSGNVVSLLADFGVILPTSLTTSYVDAVPAAVGSGFTFVAGAGFNVVAAAGILAVTGLLVLGVSESAKVNNVIVFIKVGILLLFIGMGVAYVNVENWQPLIPPNEGGFHYGIPGVFRAASVIFFAYVGFEAVSTAAAEAKNPARDIPIGILGSLVVCTIIYMATAAVLTGIVPFRELGVAAPIALAVDRMEMPWFSLLIKVGTIAGLTSVMLILTYGQSRIFYAIARDGLLPRVFSLLHRKFRTPWAGTLILGVGIAVLASMLPIGILGDLVSLGTASAFGIVSLSVMYLRTARSDLLRPFRVPLGGGMVSQPVAILVGTVMAFLGLAFFRFLLESTWTDVGAIIVVVAAAVLLVLAILRKGPPVWLGFVPLAGVFFAFVMAGPLIEDVVIKAATGDPLPAWLLTGYFTLGAAIYVVYGYWNSRLAQGLQAIEDTPGLSPFEAQRHGVDQNPDI